MRLTVGEDRSYPTVKAAWASPLTYPNRYLSLLNGKGEEIVMLETVQELPIDSRQAALEELAMRYLTATVISIINARNEFGVTYWHVMTDRGERDFVTQSLQENAQWLSPTQLMLMDVDGNRFELKDVSAMDQRSMTLLETIL